MTDTWGALFRDVNPGMGRVRVSSLGDKGQHLCMTITPRQTVIVFKDKSEPRLLLGEEAMILHGYPVAAVSDLVGRSSNNMMSDLAGNMASPPLFWP